MKEMTTQEKEKIENIMFVLAVGQTWADNVHHLEGTTMFKHSLKKQANKTTQEIERILNKVDFAKSKSNYDTDRVNAEELTASRFAETLFKMYFSLDAVHRQGFFNDMELVFKKYYR